MLAGRASIRLQIESSLNPLMHAVDQMCLARTDVSNLFKTLEYGARQQLRGKIAVEGFCTTSESSWSLSHRIRDGRGGNGRDYVSCGINLPVPVNPMISAGKTFASVFSYIQLRGFLTLHPAARAEPVNPPSLRYRGV
jgi:hypothetical protein